MLGNISKELTINSCFELSNTVKMPCIGFGSATIGEWMEDQVYINRTAIDLGYRLFDTSPNYLTESAIGRAIKESGIPRDDFFLATKIEPYDVRRGADFVLRTFEESLNRMKTDYIDLLMFHWISQGFWLKSYQALELLYRSGRVRAIGMCNCPRAIFVEIEALCEIRPQVCQQVFNPYCMNNYDRLYCRRNQIVFQAESPLGNGKEYTFFKEPALLDAAENHKKTVQQVALRWCLQHDVGILPRSSNVEHIKSNIDIFDFELTAEEMNKIDMLNEEGTIFMDPYNVNY